MVGGEPTRRRVRRADDVVLRQEIDRIVARRPGRGSRVAALHKSRFPYIGSYDCYSVVAELADGEVLRFFLKDFGFSRQSKDSPEERRDRELRVYRDLLAGSTLGTAQYHGCVWDASQDRFWLLLELVEGVLIEEADLASGIEAARWLARLHGHFVHHPGLLASCDFLMRHDAGFFRSKGERALCDVAELCPASGRRLETVLDRYQAAIGSMAAEPHTLVHGGYIPWHILLDLSCQPPRVCAIDWELAALGSTLYDLALFTDDAEPPVRDGICDAYRAEASRQGVAVLDRASMRHVVRCFRLHRVLDWLSRGREKGFSEEKVAWLVDRAVLLSQGIDP